MSGKSASLDDFINAQSLGRGDLVDKYVANWVKEARLARWLINNLLNESQLSVVYKNKPLRDFYS